MAPEGVRPPAGVRAPLIMPEGGVVCPGEVAAEVEAEVGCAASTSCEWRFRRGEVGWCHLLSRADD